MRPSGFQSYELSNSALRLTQYEQQAWELKDLGSVLHDAGGLLVLLDDDTLPLADGANAKVPQHDDDPILILRRDALHADAEEVPSVGGDATLVQFAVCAMRDKNLRSVVWPIPLKCAPPCQRESKIRSETHRSLDPPNP